MSLTLSEKSIIRDHAAAAQCGYMISALFLSGYGCPALHAHPGVGLPLARCLEDLVGGRQDADTYLGNRRHGCAQFRPKRGQPDGGGSYAPARGPRQSWQAHRVPGVWLWARSSAR